MPIYEFYCGDCHTVFSFFSRTVDTAKRPACPRCGRADLDRRLSRFAISKGRPAPAGPEGDLPEPDETKMEQAMEELAGQAEGLDEENPRQMARVLKKLCESAGLPMNEAMREAIRRMEAGESPEKIEEELGGLWDEDAPSAPESGGLHGLARRLKPPAVDQTLYDL
jgi:putative FmdB family regulatory protein